MTATPQIDVRDLSSVRRAAKTGAEAETEKSSSATTGSTPARPAMNLREAPAPGRLGAAQFAACPQDHHLQPVALIIIVAGMFFLSTRSRDNLTFQRANGLVNEAELIADVFEAQLPGTSPVNLITGDGIDMSGDAGPAEPARRHRVLYVSMPPQRLSAKRSVPVSRSPPGAERDDSQMLITRPCSLWDDAGRPAAGRRSVDTASSPRHRPGPGARERWRAVPRRNSARTRQGKTMFAVATPITGGPARRHRGADQRRGRDRRPRAHSEREQLLQMFVIAVLVRSG